MANSPGARVTVGVTPVVTATPTITASSAYTAGNEVGGLLSFQNAVGSQAATGIIESIFIQSKSVQTASFTIYLFSSQPSATTWSDKTAPSINAADISKLIGAYTLSTALSGLGTHTLYVLDAIGKVVLVPAATLYGILTTSGTPTFGSASDLTIGVGILAD